LTLTSVGMPVPVLPPLEVPAGVAALTSPADAGAAVWLVLQATIPSASAVLARANLQKARDMGPSSLGLVYLGGVVLAGCGGVVVAGGVLVAGVFVCAPPPTEPFAASCCWTA